MNKTQLSQSIKAKIGCTNKMAMGIIDAFVESVEEALAKGEKVQLVGFGTFEVREVEAKTGVSKLHKDEQGNTIEKPWTKEGYNKPAFKAGKLLKDRVKAGK